MVPYFGDFPANATVYIPINTFDSNDPAASVTVTNLVNTDVHIHKDGGTTQRNNAAGITMSIDYDSITGNHLLTIDTSDTTVADFWQAGHEYQVRVEGITVDAGTINAWVGSFSIERAGGALALIKSATYGLSALKTLLDTTGIKVASFANNAITANAINNDAITAAKIANGAIDNATFAADVGSTAYATNIIALAAKKAIDEYDPPTNAEFELRSLPAADYTVVSDLGTVQTGDSFAIVNGDHGLVSIQDDIDAILSDTNELQTDWHDGGRLDLLLDGASAPSAADVADAVWDEALAGHAGAGSAGAALTAAGSAGDPWSTALPGAYGAGTAGLLLGTTIPAAIDAIDNYVDTEIGALTTELAKVPKSDSNVSWNATALAAIQGECTDALNAYDPPTNAEMEARTLAAADYTVVSDLGTVQTGDSFAIVNGDHGLVSIQDDIDSILADTNEVQADLVNGGRLDLLIDGIKAKTDSLTFTQAGHVDANVQRINDVAITGDGSATPFNVV